MAKMETAKAKNDYGKKNKAIMEMIGSSKDKDFSKQIRFANQDVREHINMLMEGEAKLNNDQGSQIDLQKKASV